MERAAALSALHEGEPLGVLFSGVTRILGEFINTIKEEVFKTMEKFYRVVYHIRDSIDEEGLQGVLMDMLVEARLYANFDWQAWVASMQPVVQDSE